MLEQIVSATRRRISELLGNESQIRTAAEASGPVRGFEVALSDPGLSVIAEFKRASPSRGILNGDMDPASQAARYAAGGAAALSVLTEPAFFGGLPGDLATARSAAEIPVLRKDFTLDPVQVWEARALGADAVLLIVAVLDTADFADLLKTADEAGLAAVVEVHDAEEARRAVDAGAAIIGVNNRDLHTFDVDLATAEKLAPLLDGTSVTIAESGIQAPEDAARMRTAGYDAVLVGEHLVRAPDPSQAIEDLRNA